MRASLLLMIFLCCAAAYAEEPALSDTQLEKLVEVSPKQYLPILLKRLDETMATVLKKRLDHSTDEVKAALLDSQKAWLAFRDADSRLEAAEDAGGSGISVFVLERRIYQTKLRIYQLDTAFQQGWKPVPGSRP